MRIIFTSPWNSRSYRSSPDLGLGYLAACLREDGHDVHLDLRPGREKDLSGFVDRMTRAGFDIYGIKVMSADVMAARQTVQALRQADPRAMIIVGGPHVSGDPEHIFSLFPGIHYAFYGEAEIGLRQFIRARASNALAETLLPSIPNLIWRQNGRTVINPGQWIQDLDTIPFPAWELMDPRDFPDNPFGGWSRRSPIAPLIITRGCPSRCTFCGAGNVNGHEIRSRSAENVIQEIRLLTSKFHVREIQFWDSNCSHVRSSLREVCRRLVQENIDITWSAPNGIRLDSIDETLPELMKRSGCFMVNVGIESGSARILRQIHKGLSLETVDEKIKGLRRAGIQVGAYFMLGFPGETLEEIYQTMDLAMRLPLTGAYFSIFSPLPGTEIYQDLFKDRPITLDELQSLDFRNYRNNLSKVPCETLRQIQRRAYRRFHLRPSVLRHVIKNFGSPSKMRFLAHTVYELALRR